MAVQCDDSLSHSREAPGSAQAPTPGPPARSGSGAGGRTPSAACSWRACGVPNPRNPSGMEGGRAIDTISEHLTLEVYHIVRHNEYRLETSWGYTRTGVRSRTRCERASRSSTPRRTSRRTRRPTRRRGGRVCPRSCTSTARASRRDTYYSSSPVLSTRNSEDPSFRCTHLAALGTLLLERAQHLLTQH